MEVLEKFGAYGIRLVKKYTRHDSTLELAGIRDFLVTWLARRWMGGTWSQKKNKWVTWFVSIIKGDLFKCVSLVLLRVFLVEIYDNLIDALLIYRLWKRVVYSPPLAVLVEKQSKSIHGTWYDPCSPENLSNNNQRPFSNYVHMVP